MAKLELSLDERLLKLATTDAEQATQISNLTKDIGSLSKSVAELRDIIRNLADRISQGREVNWGTIISLGMFVLAVVGVASALIIGRIDSSIAIENKDRNGVEKLLLQQLTYLEEQLRDTSKTSQTNASSIVAINRNLNEIETQFFWQGDVEAGERADSARIQQLLWKKIYGEDLPPKNPYQRGPQKHSTIHDLTTFTH